VFHCSVEADGAFSKAMQAEITTRMLALRSAEGAAAGWAVKPASCERARRFYNAEQGGLGAPVHPYVRAAIALDRLCSAASQVSSTFAAIFCADATKPGVRPLSSVH
jgi:hypothetical protein